MSAQTKLSRFTTLALRLRRLKREYNKALTELQGSCRHHKIIECDYKSMNFGSSMPPMRVCTICGVVEEGWGCGFDKLRSTLEYTEKLREFIPLVSRQRVYSYIRRPE